MNGEFKKEIQELLQTKKLSINRLAFQIGVSESYLCHAFAGKKSLTQKTLSSIIDSFERDFGFSEDQLYRLAILGVRRYLAERGLEKVCIVRPDAVMAWIHSEPTYAAKISIKQKSFYQRQIREKRCA